MLQACGKEKKLVMEQSRFVASDTAVNAGEETTLEVWTWGRGEAGQLGLGKESTERSPSLLEFLPHKYGLALMPGVLHPPQVPRPNSQKLSPESSEMKSAMPLASAVRRYSGVADNAREVDADEEVGISCGLFHSCFWKTGELWLWGKGDGGRLGTGSEVSVYTPQLIPSLSGVKSVALGGLHSAAITRDGDVYTL